MNLKIIIGLVLLALFVVVYHLVAAEYARQAEERLRRGKDEDKYAMMLNQFHKIGSYEFWLTGSDKYEQLSEFVHPHSDTDNQQEDKE